MRFELAFVVSIVVGACTSESSEDAGSRSDAATTIDASLERDAETAEDAGTTSTSCPVVGYAACGGDLLGTWTIERLCPEDPEAAAALFEHPYDNLPACQDRTENFVQGMLIHVGTVVFTSTAIDLDFATNAEVAYGFTDACLVAIDPNGADGSSRCAALASPGRLTCSYTANLCTCSASIEDQPIQESLPLELRGDDTFVSDGVQATYCVDGTSVVIDWEVHPVSWRYWILSR